MTYPNTSAVPRMADCHGWEAKLIGEVPILGYIIERLMVDYPHTKYDYSGLFLTDVSNVVVKVYNLCRV